MKQAVWSLRPVVYRCYDAAGVLLYIGSTINVDQRMEAHLGTSFWRERVARVRIQIASDELAARRMEAAAIRAENPRFNLIHRRPRSQWTGDDYRDVLTALRAKPATDYTRARITSLTRENSHRWEAQA